MSFARRADIPHKIGRYEVLEPIGSGAMGAVYKGFDPLIKRTVAIKTIRLDVAPGSSSHRAFIERFRTEVQVSGTLSHPNIVTLFDIGESADELPFLTMEYVAGETIAELLDRGGQLEPERVVGLVSQVASAIDYAHMKGVIHRDIKPSNIIVHEGDKVKVTDFGIAKVMDEDVTQTETLLGTPSYMSPEQAMGENLDGRTDIFSLGVVAFEMLSGQQPFPGNNVTSVLYKLVHVDPVRPDNLELLGLIPDKWHEVFSKVLAKNPAERYQTAASFVSDLELCLGSWFGAVEGETLVGASPMVSRASGQDAASEPVPARPAEKVDPRPDEDHESEDELPEVPTVQLSAEDWQVALQGSEGSDERRDTVSLHRLDNQNPGAEKDGGGTEPAIIERTRSDSSLRPDAGWGDRSTTTLTLPGVGPSALDPSQVPTQAVTFPGAPVDRPRKARRIALGLAFALLGLAGLASVIALVGASGVASLELPPVAPTSSSPSEAGSEQAGEIDLRTSPEGATVLLDGELSGRTPLHLKGLPHGLHLVRIEMEGFQSLELPANLSPDASSLKLAVTLAVAAKAEAAAPAAPVPMARLDVSSSPSGARVLVDGEVIGETPLEAWRGAPGERTVRVEKEGFEVWERAIWLFDGTTSSVSAELEPVVVADAPTNTPGVREGELVEPGPGVTDPVCIHCPAVPYPEVARRTKLEGLVEVSFIITETGEVSDIEITRSGLEVFNRAVIDTLRTYRYEPATKAGVRVKIRRLQRFRFQRGR